MLDAVAFSQALPEIARAERVADLGTGAGFPGLPIAILNPHVEVRLVDSRRKRHHFQRAAKRALLLDNVIPLLGRSDQIEAVPSEVVVAQAMAEPEVALPLMAEWAGPAATLALPASETAGPPIAPAGWTAPELREYVVPVAQRKRRIWVLERASRV